MNAGSGAVQRLEELRAAGAARFDRPAVRMIEGLLSRREGVGEGAASLLEARAAARLESLTARFTETRRRAEEELQRLKELGHDPRGELTRAFSAGDLGTVLRAARRHPASGARRHPRVDAALRERLEGAAEARGLTSPGALASPDAHAPEPTELAALLYRDAAAQASARITLARALDDVPDEAGRYHAGSVAARAVALMAERYPTYLHAQLARLEALAALAAFACPADGSASAADHETGGGPDEDFELER